MDTITPSGEERVAALLRAASVEVYEKNASEKLDGFFAPGADVYVSFLPGDDVQRRVDICALLRAGGYNPVPHVPARQMVSARCLDDYIAGVSGAANVTRVLLIAGDSTRARGPYETSRQVIESGVLQKHGIRFVDVAGHPEGNAGLSPERLTRILAEKITATQAAGLDLGIVTQFSFAPRPIADWLVLLHGSGIAVPIRIGLAGPANPATLLRFALRCGIGNSISAVQKHVGTIGRLLKDTGPDGVVRGLADVLASPAGAGVANFHFFPFGGIAKTGRWIEAMLREMN